MPPHIKFVLLAFLLALLYMIFKGILGVIFDDIDLILAQKILKISFGLAFVIAGFLVYFRSKTKKNGR